MQNDNPLIVQSDRTLLLDVHAPRAEACRAALIPFTELVCSPEHLHTYRLTPLSLWNAASAGFTPDDAVRVLHDYTRYDVPRVVEMWIQETAGRFGKLRLIPGPVVDVHIAENSNETIKEEYLYLLCSNEAVYKEIYSSPAVKKLFKPYNYKSTQQQHSVNISDKERTHCFMLPLTDRGTVKQILLSLGWPVDDQVPLVDGEKLEINLRKITKSGKPFIIRDYQRKSCQALVGDKGPGTGFGTIVLPCGAGKTMVGMAIMEMLKTSTLIVTTNISAVHQWIEELLDKTDLLEDKISEYTGESKDIQPVTVTTYQTLTWRPDKTSPFPHFSLFRKRHWGLIIYDEVHVLPAPVFRVAAELQAVRRVGLTATLVREDGMEGHVFSLVGPKRYDVPWKDLERTGWIATAECIEIRLDLDESLEMEYATSDTHKKHRIASGNPAKLPVIQQLVKRYPNDKILVIGQYINQLNDIAHLLCAPIIMGKTSTEKRDELYRDFRCGNIRILVVSKVANFAIDLPDASMAIQVSGTFGSRQEEAQRVGRILRPKDRMSRFFTLITRNTVEEDFGANRQKFLVEQGYRYRIIRYTKESDLEELSEPLCRGDM